MNQKIVRLHAPRRNRVTENAWLRAEIHQLRRALDALTDDVRRMDRPTPWGFDARDCAENRGIEL